MCHVIWPTAQKMVLLTFVAGPNIQTSEGKEREREREKQGKRTSSPADTQSQIVSCMGGREISAATVLSQLDPDTKVTFSYFHFLLPLSIPPTLTLSVFSSLWLLSLAKRGLKHRERPRERRKSHPGFPLPIFNVKL